MVSTSDPRVTRRSSKLAATAINATVPMRKANEVNVLPALHASVITVTNGKSAMLPHNGRAAYAAARMCRRNSSANFFRSGQSV